MVLNWLVKVLQQSDVPATLPALDAVRHECPVCVRSLKTNVALMYDDD